MEADNLESEEALWCIVANVKGERSSGHGGEETRSGTRQFRGGSKIYIIGCYPGMCDTVVAIGMQRKSRRFIVCAISVNHVENFRAKLAYNPKVIELAKNDDRYRVLTEDQAKEWASVYLTWQEQL